MVIALAAGLAGAAYGQSAPAATNPPPPASARQVIDSLTKGVLAILRDPALDKPTRRQKVRELAYQYLDFETLSRLTMGQNWRGLSDTQRAEFVQEYRKHLTATYGHTSDEYTDEDIKITGDRAETNGDATVLTSIIGTKQGTRQEIAKMEYRLRKTGNAWKIIDVTIDSVSLMANFRSQFQDVMSNGGFDKLIKLLREKNAAADK